MSGTTRTFLAAPLPPTVVSALDRLSKHLEPKTPGLRWVDSINYHITLLFLGEVADHDLEPLGRETADALAGLAPPELRIAGLGAFPSPTRPRVLWAGVAGPGVDALAEAQRAVVGAAARVGYRPHDAERFHPHVTLARFAGRSGPPPDLRGLLTSQAGFASETFRVAEVVVYASQLTPQGPSYTRVATADLSGSAPA